MPTSPSQPQPATQPQTESAVGASPYDRMQAEVKALQQQAQATQASLTKLQTQEAADPVDGTVPVVAAVLVVVALVGWYLWRRPQNRPVDAGHTKISELTEQTPTAPPIQESPVRVEPVQPVASPQPTPAPTPVPSSPFAKPEPPVGFDSEAAASEVIRVRKSLAEKREARFLLHDQQEPATPDPWNMPGEGSYGEVAPSFGIDIHFTLPDDPPAPEPMPEPEFAPEPVADRQAVSTELDINIDEVGDAPQAPDYATMLALAQVSEELEQLNEARDLAYEVLQSDDPALQSQARALLDRLSEVESEMGPESVRWDDLR